MEERLQYAVFVRNESTACLPMGISYCVEGANDTQQPPLPVKQHSFSADVTIVNRKSSSVLLFFFFSPVNCSMTVKYNTLSILGVTQVCVTAVRRDFSNAEVDRSTWTDKWTTSFHCQFSIVD